MNRRLLLASLGVSITVSAGCLGFADKDKNHAVHVDQVSSSEINSEADDICEYEGLSEDVQAEVKRAVEENGYTTDSHPSLTDSDCYHSYIYYETVYYEFSVSVN